jgi:hypothetical protein
VGVSCTRHPGEGRDRWDFECSDSTAPACTGATYFTHNATRLAGLTGALLGWRPHEFWNATPAELAAILTALTSDAANPADHDLITLLKEQFPDG